MNCDKEPGWHTDTWRHQSTRQTLRTCCHNCHKPTVTITGTVRAELRLVETVGFFVCKPNEAGAHACMNTHVSTHASTNTQSSTCPSVKIWPNQFGLAGVQTMQPLRGTAFTEFQLGLHIPQLKTQTASPPGKPLKLQHHIPHRDHILCARAVLRPHRT